MPPTLPLPAAVDPDSGRSDRAGAPNRTRREGWLVAGRTLALSAPLTAAAGVILGLLFPVHPHWWPDPVIPQPPPAVVTTTQPAPAPLLVEPTAVAPRRRAPTSAPPPAPTAAVPSTPTPAPAPRSAPAPSTAPSRPNGPTGSAPPTD